MQAHITSEGILSILGKGKGILPSSKRMKKAHTRPMQGEGGLPSDEGRWEVPAHRIAAHARYIAWLRSRLCLFLLGLSALNKSDIALTE